MTRELDKPGVDRSRDLECLLQPAIDEERIAANWQRVAKGRRRDAMRPHDSRTTVELPHLGARRRNRRFARWFALGAATVVAAVAVYLAWPHGGPLGAIDVGIAPGSVVDAPARRLVAFDDGSAIDLADGTRLQVLTNESDRFALLLLRGRARFDVHPGGPRRWEIETPRATVEVVGTAFTVESDDRRVVVAVERGVVMVRGERVPGRVARLVAGDRIEIDDAPARDAHAATPPAIAPPTKNASTNRPAPSKPSPRVAAADPLRPPPGARPTSDSKKLAAILGSVEQRRASGDAAGAAELLESALATTRDDPSLGLAEFTLGRLYLEDLGAPDRAAAAVARMIALGSPHALLEDAYARRIEALVRALRIDDARAALDEYDRLYPHGLRRTALHALLP
jgi:transmembrane sensor